MSFRFFAVPRFLPLQPLRTGPITSPLRIFQPPSGRGPALHSGIAILTPRAHIRGVKGVVADNLGVDSDSRSISSSFST